MKILHVIPSLSETEGGPTYAVQAMATALAAEGVQVTIATTGEEMSIADGGLRISGVIDPGCSVVCFRRNFEQYKVSFGLAKWLRQNITAFDLVHIHALFSFSSTMAARIAHRNNVPYVVRPLGVLNRWGLKNRRRILKIVSLRFVELPILRNAAAIHFTCEAERDEAADLDRSFNESRVVIPLPIPPAVPGNAESFRNRYPQLRDRKVILFLSRIDRKKGLELLMNAFETVRTDLPDARLVIAGQGDASYVNELRGRASAAGEETNIVWTGHLSGEMKTAALAAAGVFVLPSASENFGIAAAESLAAGVPTIVSEEVGLSSDIRRCNAGLVVPRDASQLAGAIVDLLSNEEKARTLAANGKQLAYDRYSPAAVGKALHELYAKILSARTQTR